MAITKDDVKYVSSLARIEMNDKELASFTDQLDKILDYMKKLNELNTDSIKPTAHILDLKNVQREDKQTDDNVTPEEIKEMAPDSEDSFITVPKVIE